MCFSCICLFVLYVLIFVIFLFLLVSGVVAVYDCGTPWTFQENSVHTNPVLRSLLISVTITLARQNYI